MTITRRYYGLDDMRVFNAHLSTQVGEKVLEVLKYTVKGLPADRYGNRRHSHRYEQREATIVSVERKLDNRDEDSMYWTSWEECLLDNGSVYRRNNSIERWHAEGAHFGSDAIKDAVQRNEDDTWLYSADIYPADFDHDEYLRRALIAERTKEIGGWINSSKMTGTDVAHIEAALEHLMHVHGRIGEATNNYSAEVSGP